MKHEKGQSLVEFALSLPILVMIAAGIMDLGRIYFVYTAMEDVAAEGANYFGAFPGNVEEAENRVSSFENGDFVNLLSDLDNAAVTLSCYDLETKEPLECEDAQVLDVVKVDMYYEYELLAPFIFEINGMPTITLHSSATQIITGQ